MKLKSSEQAFAPNPGIALMQLSSCAASFPAANVVVVWLP